MRPLSAAGVLRAWERGQAGPPLDRALAILAVANPEDSWDGLARLPIGQRDARLLASREQSLGGALRAYVECPACKAALTFEMNVPDLRSDSHLAEQGGTYDIAMDTTSIRFRLPTTLDLADLPLAAGVAVVRRQLAEHCVLQAERDGRLVDIDALPDELIDLVSEEMSRRDPQAETEVNLSCPECDHQWSAIFDIAAFFWAEIAALASRLLREVDVLARAYGWREADILELSASRRDAYLQLAQS
jgi:hypothetical protein